MIAMEDFYTVMWPQVEKVLDREDCRTFVAYEDDQLYGFIALDTNTAPLPPLVFYIYVKGPYRRWKPQPGIGRQLFAAAGIDPSRPFDYAYRTPEVSRLAVKIPLARHQPMLARFPKGQGRRR